MQKKRVLKRPRILPTNVQNIVALMRQAEKARKQSLEKARNAKFAWQKKLWLENAETQRKIQAELAKAARESLHIKTQQD